MEARSTVRKHLLAGLGSALLLATACGDDSSSAASATTGTDTGTSSTTGDAGTASTGTTTTTTDAGTDAATDSTLSCDAGTSICSGVCVDTQSDPANCGACANACGATEACTAGTCALRPTGDGADGAFAPDADATLGAVRSGGLAIAAGARVATVLDTTGFAAGDLVLLHQTRGTGAGAYELGQIASVDAAAGTVTLLRAVTHAYGSTGDVDRAQIVRVPQFTTVTVPSGVTITAPAWDGASGGILAFVATGTVTIAGTLDVRGRGFRGYSHAGQCAAGTVYACTAADTADGFSGESAAGPSAASAAANGAGGGGGSDGQDCGAGGGGGHGTAGTVGSNGGGAACRDDSGVQPGGAGGAAAGSADLASAIFLGGAGGEGGADEDGAYPGKGGNGGGVVLVSAESVVVSGAIVADGEVGGDGVQYAEGCGGGGSGMGAGGGGGGGAIAIRATSSVDLGAGVEALGAGGGICGNTTGSPGGTGGAGRIAVVAATITGTSQPAIAAH